MSPLPDPIEANWRDEFAASIRTAIEEQIESGEQVNHMELSLIAADAIVDDVVVALAEAWEEGRAECRRLVEEAETKERENWHRLIIDAADCGALERAQAYALRSALPLRSGSPSNPEAEIDSNLYTESELFCAGAMSTLPPFDTQHPSACLPYTRRVLEALGEWEPTDGGSPSNPPTDRPHCSADDHSTVPAMGEAELTAYGEPGWFPYCSDCLDILAERSHYDPAIRRWPSPPTESEKATKQHNDCEPCEGTGTILSTGTQCRACNGYGRLFR